MTRKHLQDWYYSDDITYSEKERLNKIGVSDYDYYYLEDLEQILRCETWAKYSSEIRNKLDGRIKKIIFFTPNFNDSKPDASNYSCAIITDGSDNDWVIVYRPSYVANIRDDVVIKKVSNLDETESKLNGDYPITAVAPERGLLLENSFFSEKKLPSDVEYNPDKYILPLDIVARPVGSTNLIHLAIYLGNGWVVHLPGGGEPTKFDTWYKFYDGSSSSGFSSGSSGNNEKIGLMHPQIPFKRKEEIIRHIAKTISHRYGGCYCHFYDATTNNCESLALGCVLGIDFTSQGAAAAGSMGPVSGLVSLFSTGPVSTFNNFKNAFANHPLWSMAVSSDLRMTIQKNKFDDLTSSYSDEKGKIEQYIQEAENNRNYIHSRDQIKDEKFEERIVVHPKDWCRVS